MERRPMDEAEPQPSASFLEDWRAEVGDEEILRIVEATRRDAASGLIPSFTDREALLAHWRERARRPA
jgi:hypothetical protein